MVQTQLSVRQYNERLFVTSEAKRCLYFWPEGYETSYRGQSVDLSSSELTRYAGREFKDSFMLILNYKRSLYSQPYWYRLLKY